MVCGRWEVQEWEIMRPLPKALQGDAISWKGDGAHGKVACGPIFPHVEGEALVFGSTLT